MALRSVKPIPIDMWNKIMADAKRELTPEEVKKYDKVRNRIKEFQAKEFPRENF